MFDIAKRASLVLCAILAVTACKDTADPEPEPDVSSLRLTIGATNAQTVNVATNPGCAVTGGPITLKVNTPTAITGSFLNAGGTADPIANSSDFRMAGTTTNGEIAPTPNTITFTRTGNFSGTLNGTATTTAGSASFALVHIEEGHADWGPCTVAISVVP